MKKSLLKKTILSILILAIFLAPVSGGIGINKNNNLVAKVEVNDARASGPEGNCVDTTKGTSFGQTTEADCTAKNTSGGDAYAWAPVQTLKLGCSSLLSIDFPSCVAQISYLIETVSAAIATVAGQFLDFFVYYSTNSSSYNNDFVKQGWAAVRDIANIFFIIALLYVAIKTILNLNVTDNKKLIGAVVVIALIINFSLFATELVIDGSNILAKVFYNGITPVGANGQDVSNVGGQKSISVGLVDKFDPETLITQPIYDANQYTFIFMTLIIAAILLYMTYIFFSVALFFVARVVSLWIAMIFSPIAFVSYSVPFDIPGMGHKEWWTELWKNAFLAPLFIFFLYIIVLFTGFLKNIISYTYSTNLTGNANTTQHLMSVLIPFIIIAGLLMKAKKLAAEYSGEMGKAISKVGSMIGGTTVGMGAGALAFGARASIGRVAANLAESERFRNFAAEHPKFGGGLLKATSGIGAGSFDVRGIKVGGKGLADTGLTNLGKAQVGGFAGARAAAVKKQEEFANKMLDTSDYGKAELTRGGMTHEEAITLTRRMGRGGMNALDQARHYRSLMGGGIAARDVSGVARYLDAAKRETYADRIENRSRNRLTGIFGPAERTSAKKRISANKIRKDFGALSTQANMNQMLANLAAAGGPAPAAPAPAAPAPAAPAPGHTP